MRMLGPAMLLSVGTVAGLSSLAGLPAALLASPFAIAAILWLWMLAVETADALPSFGTEAL